MTIFMGIDGGGSNLRVVLIDAEMNLLCEVTKGSANPNLIGRKLAAEQIQDAMREALERQPDVTVQGVGIGIAGASAEHASAWLHKTVRAVLPDAHIAAASDNEIALVGALGQAYGMLILSGTGSGVFAINRAGEKLQVGGWGYLLGDEGSGFWIGLQAIKHATLMFDHAQSTLLSEAVLKALNLDNGRGLIEQVYLTDNFVPRVARLAPTVFELVDEDNTATTIVERAADALYEQAQTTMKRLNMASPLIAFAGSIIANDTPVSKILRNRFGEKVRRQPLHRPVVGAALLAKYSFQTSNTKGA
ncbi:MAG: BadF/BadG/BcrA/BcrD ATPase family protein [Chloroflexota bacterium]